MEKLISDPGSHALIWNINMKMHWTYENNMQIHI